MKVLLKFKNLLYQEKLFLIVEIAITFVFAFSLNAFSQTDKVKWEKAEYTFTKKDVEGSRDYSLDGGPLNISLKVFLDAYWVFFSDPSGDVCPFSPSCSNFFLQGVQKTNIFQGGLMFFDRFTRDMNFVNRLYKYPAAKNGKLLDPVDNYLINSDKIVYIPPIISNK